MFTYVIACAFLVGSNPCRRLSVKLEKNSIFLKNGKTVISVENQKFFRSRITKRIAPLNSSREI